jgi:hypothetical protein
MARRHYKSDDQAPSIEPTPELAVPQDTQPMATTAPDRATQSPPPVSGVAAAPVDDDHQVLARQLAQLEQANQLQMIELQRQRTIIEQSQAIKAEWIRAHPEFHNRVGELGPLHYEALKKHADNSPGYFAFLEGEMRKPDSTGTPAATSTPNPSPAEPEPARRTMAAPVSAPVTREVRSLSGNQLGPITLTAAQREAARLANVDERTYAANLLKLRQLQATGQYPPDR